MNNPVFLNDFVALSIVLVGMASIYLNYTVDAEVGCFLYSVNSLAIAINLSFACRNPVFFVVPGVIETTRSFHQGQMSGEYMSPLNWSATTQLFFAMKVTNFS